MLLVLTVMKILRSLSINNKKSCCIKFATALYLISLPEVAQYYFPNISFLLARTLSLLTEKF